MNSRPVHGLGPGRVERTLILAPNPDGHRATYIRHLVEAAGGSRSILIGSTADGFTRESFDRQLGATRSHWTPVEMAGFDGASVAQTARSLAIDHVVAPDGDALALEIGRQGSWRGPQLTALIMREDAQVRQSRVLSIAVRQARALTLARAGRVGGVQLLMLRAPYDTRPHVASYAVDPVELWVTLDSREYWRDRFGLDDRCRWIALVGANTARKRAELVAAAVRELGSGFGLLATGRTDQATRAALQSARDIRMRVVDRYLDDDEVDGAILACDALAAAYDNDGPSGIVAKALALGTPAVVAPTRAATRALKGSNAPVIVASDTTVTGIAAAISAAALIGRAPATDFSWASPKNFADALLDGSRV